MRPTAPTCWLHRSSYHILIIQYPDQPSLVSPLIFHWGVLKVQFYIASKSAKKPTLLDGSISCVEGTSIVHLTESYFRCFQVFTSLEFRSPRSLALLWGELKLLTETLGRMLRCISPSSVETAWTCLTSPLTKTPRRESSQSARWEGEGINCAIRVLITFMNYLCTNLEARFITRKVKRKQVKGLKVYKTNSIQVCV